MRAQSSHDANNIKMYSQCQSFMPTIDITKQNKTLSADKSLEKGNREGE